MGESIKLDRRQFEALDLKLNGINGAINRLSDNLGKWLSLIAQAQAGPEDSTAIRDQITKLKASGKALAEATESSKS